MSRKKGKIIKFLNMLNDMQSAPKTAMHKLMIAASNAGFDGNNAGYVASILGIDIGLLAKAQKRWIRQCYKHNDGYVPGDEDDFEEQQSRKLMKRLRRKHGLTTTE